MRNLETLPRVLCYLTVYFVKSVENYIVRMLPFDYSFVFLIQRSERKRLFYKREPSLPQMIEVDVLLKTLFVFLTDCVFSVLHLTILRIFF